MSNNKHPETPSRLAIPAKEVARLLSFSERTIWSMNATGRLPTPHRFGRAVRWSLPELESWQVAGCPSRSQWETIKSNDRKAG